jgi:hypothetical protein
MMARGRRLGAVIAALGLVAACSLLATGARLGIDALNSPADASVVSPLQIAAADSSASASASASAAASSSAAAADAAAVTSALAALTTTLNSTAGVDDDTVSIAAYDPATGLAYTYGDDSDFDTASVVKVDILATLMLQNQDAGTSLTASQLSTATSMIENSDNDSATALWDEIDGDAGLNAANVRLGLTSTVGGTDGYWGLTTTTADDQVTLLKAVTADDSILDAASRATIIGLMSDVESDQAWGVSAAADADGSVALKNGWVNIVDDDDLWVVGSIGQITVDGSPLLIAVLTHHQASENDGIDLVEQLAGTVAPVLAAART